MWVKLNHFVKHYHNITKTDEGIPLHAKVHRCNVEEVKLQVLRCSVHSEGVFDVVAPVSELVEAYILQSVALSTRHLFAMQFTRK